MILAGTFIRFDIATWSVVLPKITLLLLTYNEVVRVVDEEENKFIALYLSIPRKFVLLLCYEYQFEQVEADPPGPFGTLFLSICLSVCRAVLLDSLRVLWAG